MQLINNQVRSFQNLSIMLFKLISVTKWSHCLVPFIYLFQVSLSAVPEAYFYALEGNYGLHFSSEISDKCTNIPRQGHAVPLTRAVIADECIIVYEMENCGGGSVNITGRMNTLSPYSFLNRAQSFQPCHMIDPENVAVTISFYSKPNFEGFKFTLTNITNCIHFDSQLPGVVQSVAPHGKCFTLCGGNGCSWSPIKIQPWDPQLRNMSSGVGVCSC